MTNPKDEYTEERTVALFNTADAPPQMREVWMNHRVGTRRTAWWAAPRVALAALAVVALSSIALSATLLSHHGGGPPRPTAIAPIATSGNAGATTAGTPVAVHPGVTTSASISPTPASSPISAPTALAVDSEVATDQNSQSPNISSVISTAGDGEVVVAFASTSLEAGSAQPGMTVSGGGLSWHRVMTPLVRPTAGESDVWWAVAPTRLANVLVTASLPRGPFHGILSLIAFTGADRTEPIGGTAYLEGATRQCSFVSTRAGSQSWTLGKKWYPAYPRDVPVGETLAHEYAGDGDFYLEHRTVPTANSGSTVTLADCNGPASANASIVEVEIRPAS